MTNMLSFLQNIGSVLDDISGLYEPQDDLETTITAFSMNTVMWAAILLVVLTVVAILFSGKYPKLKLPLFVLMSTAMAGSTLVLIGSTVYLNTTADSGGPVHWHADFEVWACGNELEFRDPTGFLSNKIGTATLHEHDDHRVHLEGVVVEEEIDASLGKFMYVSGGAITDGAMVVPLNDDDAGNIFEDEEDGDGPAEVNPDLVTPYIVQDDELGKVASFRDGDTCGDQVADVQVFVYSYDEETKTYEQTKIENPRDYVIYEDPNVPPGDCVIFEFGPTRDKTDKLCEQYGVRDIDRCEEFGVTDEQRAICELRQVNYEESDSIIESIEEASGPLNNPEDTNPTSTQTQTVPTIEDATGTEALRVQCETDLANLPDDAGLEQYPESCTQFDNTASELIEEAQ